MFIEGNKNGEKKLYGPKIVKQKDRPGYYIRWYESREVLRNHLVLAKLPIQLNLEVAKGHGLKVVTAPIKGDIFNNVVEKGNIILKAAGELLILFQNLNLLWKNSPGKTF